ncbi:MAG: DUF4041 domain-containing protein [Alphaproteobacteria bacterium]|jgi:hypothetical protein
MALADYLKGPKHKALSIQLENELSRVNAENAELKTQLTVAKSRYAQLLEVAKKFGAMEMIEIQRTINEERSKLRAIVEAIKLEEAKAATLAHNLRSLQNQVLVVEETLLLESFALYLPKFNLISTTEYKFRLDTVREKQKDMIKRGTAASGNLSWEVNGSKSEGSKLVNDMIKLLIRSFNNECDACIDSVKFDNVAIGEKRIRKSFDACNKLGRVMTAQLSDAYLGLKLDELHLAYEFQVKRNEEKEDGKRRREEQREQQKLEQEIRAAREKITKERKHFVAALIDLERRLTKSTSDEDRAALCAKIVEVTANNAALDGEEKQIDYRERNAKAGYVYVISNLGAFGEGVFKIGMTRRLDPMERVEELGDASVPFWFDVHAMVFSDNAPALEAKLHEKFAAGRLNKVNGRKEFFRASISEIESVIREHYDPVVEVIKEAPAEQYRESLRMTLPSAAIQQAEHEAAAHSSSPLKVRS